MNSNKYGLAVIFLIVLVGSFVFGQNSVTGNAVYGGEAQIVKLSVSGGQYIMEPAVFKKGLVRLEADISKMPGCSKSIMIPAFNVKKNFNSADSAVEFIADKAGTFNIACSMNMYQGTFTVIEEDGAKSDYVEKPIEGKSTCGSNGGCGCGG